VSGPESSPASLAATHSPRIAARARANGLAAAGTASASVGVTVHPGMHSFCAGRARAPRRACERRAAAASWQVALTAD
jgi:hypothetical protein